MFDSAPNLEYLRSFSMVVKYGSVAGAVNKSKLSLPTLSRHIKLLEAELGASLFNGASRLRHWVHAYFLWR